MTICSSNIFIWSCLIVMFFFISVASKWTHLQRESSVETDFYDPVIMDTLARVFFLEHTWPSLNVLRTLNFAIA